MAEAQRLLPHTLRGHAPSALYDAPDDDDPQELYDKAPCGYLSTQPDGIIVRANLTFCAMSGYATTDLVRKRRFSDLLTPGGRIYHETHYAPTLQMTGHAREIALDIVRSDGARIPVLVNATLDRDSTGQAAVVRIAVFDASERRAYERELLRAKQAAEESERRAMLLARTLQETLIPHRPPDIDGLQVSAVYRPAGDGTEVGGDFYDVFETSTDRCVAAVGDVRGKGAGAAVVTALARHTIRAAAVRETEPSAMLSLLNEALLNDGSDRFCSVALVVLDRTARGWRATVCSAGHPLPFLARPGHETSPFGAYGMVLGVEPDPPLVNRTTELEAGDLLLLYTDGITEARQGKDLLGEEKVLGAPALYGYDPKAVTQGLLKEALAFQFGHARDDIVVLALRTTP